MPRDKNDDRCRCGMGKTTSSPLLPSLCTSEKKIGTSSPRVPLEFGASPARSRRRLAQPTAKRRKLSREGRRCPCGDEDSFESEAVNKREWTSSPSFSSLGGGKSQRVASATPSPPRTFPIGSHLVVRLTAAPPAPIEPLEPPLPIPHAPSRNLHEEIQRRAQSGELNKTRRHSNCPHGTK